jgi:hypothetical protein
MCIPELDLCLSQGTLALLTAGVFVLAGLFFLGLRLHRKRLKEEDGFQPSPVSIPTTPPLTREEDSEDEDSWEDEDPDKEEDSEDEDSWEDEDPDEEDDSEDEDPERLKEGDIIEIEGINKILSSQMKVIETDPEEENISVEIIITLPPGATYISHQLFWEDDGDDRGIIITYRETQTGETVSECYNWDTDNLNYGGWNILIEKYRFKTS